MKFSKLGRLTVSALLSLMMGISSYSVPLQAENDLPEETGTTAQDIKEETTNTGETVDPETIEEGIFDETVVSEQENLPEEDPVSKDEVVAEEVSSGETAVASEKEGPEESEQEVEYVETAPDNNKYEVELNGFKVVAVPEDGAFTEDVFLAASVIDDGSEEYQKAETVLNESDVAYSGMLAFDIHFENAAGEEVEPSGRISVSFSAEAEVLSEIAPESVKVDSVQIVHIVEDSEETVAEVVADSSANTPEMTVEISGEAVESISADFDVDSFSTFVITWSDPEESATVHWGSYNDAGEFEEFESTTTIDTTANSVDLNVNVDGYYFVGVEYWAPEADEGETVENTSVLKKDGDTWKLGDVTVEDGSDIYVNYASKSDGSYSPPPKPGSDVLAPETTKTVTKNANGTYTVQLDIEGKQEEIVEQVGANVIIVMDITQSMTNNMPGSSSSRMAAAKSALGVLIDTLKPSENIINFTAVNFGNSANYFNGVNWTSAESDMRSYVSGLPNNPGDLGTCWQAGLQGGIDRVGTAPEGNETYVLFVTDGNPNGWVNAQGNYQQQGAGQFIQAAYNAAVPNANTLGASSHLYGIFVGDADGYTHLNDLITNANGDGVINGSSSEAMETAFEQIARTIIENLGAGNTSVDDGVPTLSDISANVTAGDAGGFEYYITEPGGEMEEWEEAPGASYDASNGVTWDLGEVGVLPNGTIYTLKFTVWPSQEAYDLIADLNNGLVDFDDLTEEEQASIVGSKETGYTLKTNTHLYTTFTDLDGKEYQEENDARPSAMDLPTTTIKVIKDWNNEMDAREAQKVTLMVTKDGEDYFEVEMGEPVKTGEHTWQQAPEKEIYISYGQIIDGVVKEPGHEYTVVEPETFSYRWDLTADIYRPMIVEGTPKVLKYTDEPTGTEGEDYYVIDGKNYEVTDSTENVLDATNDRRSSLIINKVVEAEGEDVEAPEDAEFAIKLTVDNEDGRHPGDEGYDEWNDTVWFSVQTDPADRDTIVRDVTVEGATAEEGDTGFYWFDNGATATVYLKANQYIVVPNLARGTSYTVTELLDEDMPDGFKFEEAESDADNKAGGESTPAEIDENVAEGTIDQSNTDYTVTYTNKYCEVEITVTKEWEDGGDQLGNRPDTDEFKDYLSLLIDGEVSEDYEPTVTDNGDDTYTITYTALPKYIANEEVEYTVSEDQVDGYEEPVGSPAADGGTITNPLEVGDLTISKTVESDFDSDLEMEFEFTITTEPAINAELEITGDTSEDTIEFSDGEATITLKDGESVTIKGIAANVEYTVTETEVDGFTTESEGESGTISSESAATVEFTNTRETGDLTVSKTVESAYDADKDIEFTFTVTLSDTTVTGTFGDMEFTEGVAKVTLKDGESATAEGLPAAVTYTVEEDKADGFTTESEGDSGTISSEAAATAAFTNTRFIDVKVKKVDDKKNPVKGAELAVKDESGTIVDQWVTDGTEHQVENLEPNTKYTLTELKAPAGYEKASDIKFTTDSSGTSQVLEMVDKKSVVPDTSDSNGIFGWMFMMIGSMMLAGLAFVGRRRYSN